MTNETVGEPEGYWARTKSFTRRSRAISESLTRTLADHGDTYVVGVDRGEGWTTVAADFSIDLKEIFGRDSEVTLEIGSGVGEQIVFAAKANPQRDYLALEVWQPGIAKTVAKAVREGVTNLRIIEADAQQALPFMMSDESVAEVWTFFPDPWRKARHQKRRLVNESFTPQIARILRDGGLWRLATDWDDYAWQMRDVIESSPDFANPYQGQNPDPNDPEPERGGFAPRFAGRVETRFEARGKEAGRLAHDIVGVKIPTSGMPG